MKLNKHALTVMFMLFSIVVIHAQENDDVASLDTNEVLAEAKVEYNPSGVSIDIQKNTLALYFKDRMANLRCEIINKKGEVLILKKAKSTQFSTIDITGLKKGAYFVRIYDGTLKEFLRFSKK